MKIHEPDLEYGDYISRIYPNDKTDIDVGVKTITFQVTDACNLCCSYCYQINKGVRYMSLETGKKVVDCLLDGSKGFKEYLETDKLTGVILDFIGGEPFLNIDVMDGIIDYFQEQVIILNHPWKNIWKVSIITNGTLYDNKVKAFIEKHKDHLSFSVSIDGNKQLHDSCRKFPDGKGSYDLAISTAQDQMKKGMNVGNKITISHDNLPYVFDAVKNMLDLEYIDIHGNTVFEDVWKDGDATLFYYQLKKLADYMINNQLYKTTSVSLLSELQFDPQSESNNSNFCGGTGSMLAVDPEGNLYPCLRYMESSIGTEVPTMKIGDLENGIGGCKAECDRISCLKCITRRSQCSDECFYCPIGNGCAHCSALNYQLFGTANHKSTFHCEMHKARALVNSYYWSKIFELEGCDYRRKLWVPKEWALNIIPEEEYRMILELSDSKEMSVEEAYVLSREEAKK